MADAIRDPGLPSSTSTASTQGGESTLSLGYRKISKTEEEVHYVGDIFNQVFASVGLARNGRTLLEGAIFAIGSSENGNAEWREHAASSLRELFQDWRGPGPISTAFNDAFKKKNSGFPTMKTHDEHYRRMQEYYNYFSCICHHNAVDTIIHLRNLYTQDIKTGDDNADMFLRVVRDYLSDLEDFFQQHVNA